MAGKLQQFPLLLGTVGANGIRPKQSRANTIRPYNQVVPHKSGNCCIYLFYLILLRKICPKIIELSINGPVIFTHLVDYRFGRPDEIIAVSDLMKHCRGEWHSPHSSTLGEYHDVGRIPFAPTISKSNCTRHDRKAL
jgi:hypothetical protein